MNPAGRLNPRSVLRFIREGWFWILLPALIVAAIVLLNLALRDPCEDGALHGKFIFLYSLF